MTPTGATPPARGTRKIRAFLFDTYGTVCDFYHPLKRAFDRLARDRDVACEAGRLAIEWRRAYAISTFLLGQSSEFRPLKEIHRENLLPLLRQHFPGPVSEPEIRALLSVWDRLDPWPDAVPGLTRLKGMAIIAPLSNGNFVDMVNLARWAGLPWDLVLGSSIARAYKPHPDIYRKSVEALDLEPGDVCMVAAHQVDLAYAAGHGMQTAFVRRPDEFGGPIKPRDPDPAFDSLAAAEVFPEGEWTYVADGFTALAEDVRQG